MRTQAPTSPIPLDVRQLKKVPLSAYGDGYRKNSDNQNDDGRAMKSAMTNWTLLPVIAWYPPTAPQPMSYGQQLQYQPNVPLSSIVTPFSSQPSPLPPIMMGLENGPTLMLHPQQQQPQQWQQMQQLQLHRPHSPATSTPILRYADEFMVGRGPADVLTAPPPNDPALSQSRSSQNSILQASMNSRQS
jgi:hypothetical protein